MTFGSRIKELRTERGLTQREFADALSLGESTVSFYESDKREPDYETLNKIADFFAVSIDYLMGRTDQREFIYVPSTAHLAAFHSPSGKNEYFTHLDKDELDFINFWRIKHGKEPYKGRDDK